MHKTSTSTKNRGKKSKMEKILVKNGILLLHKIVLEHNKPLSS